MEIATNFGSTRAVDGGGQRVRGIRQRLGSEFNGVALRIGDEARGRDGEGASSAQVVNLRNVEGRGDGRPGGQQGEGRFIKSRGLDTEAEAIKGDLGGWRASSAGSCDRVYNG